MGAPAGHRSQVFDVVIVASRMPPSLVMHRASDIYIALARGNIIAIRDAALNYLNQMRQGGSVLKNCAFSSNGCLLRPEARTLMATRPSEAQSLEDKPPISDPSLARAERAPRLELWPTRSRHASGIGRQLR
jgi:hypothetical protein